MSEMMLPRVAVLVEAAARREGLLGEASLYHLGTGGGRWRAMLATACAAALHVTDAAAVSLAAACELVHQASLVHDDVQDQAPMRRGQASVSARFGAPVAICVGDHLLMSAFRLLADLPQCGALIRLFGARVSEMAAGQAEEFHPTLWSAMTLRRYQSLVEAKAGAMVALPTEAALLLAGHVGGTSSAALHFARAIGIAYQVTDDVADLKLDLATGALNGVLAQALCSGTLRQQASLRSQLVHATTQGLAAMEIAALAASLVPATEAILAWRDGLLCEASKELGDHPLRQILLDAAAALAPTLMPDARLCHHAA